MAPPIPGAGDADRFDDRQVIKARITRHDARLARHVALEIIAQVRSDFWTHFFAFPLAFVNCCANLIHSFDACQSVFFDLADFFLRFKSQSLYVV